MEEGLRDCLGSKQYGICENGFTLKKSIQSYLAPIIFQDEYAAIQNSKIKTIHLPQKEKPKETYDSECGLLGPPGQVSSLLNA